MSRNSVPFGDRINDGGRVTVNAGLVDLRHLLDRIRNASEFSVSLDRTSDMDSGIELISTVQGTAIFGCEDSTRGRFGFFFYNPSKTGELLKVEVYEMPKYALCEDLENAIQIAEVFFREGELDRRFSWIIDIDVGDGVKRRNVLAAGSELPIEAFVARVANRPA